MSRCSTHRTPGNGTRRDDGEGERHRNEHPTERAVERTDAAVTVLLGTLTA